MKKYSTHLERCWIFYIICLSFGILHIIIGFDPPLWLSLIEIVVACFLEISIKNFFIKRHGIVGAMKFGIFK